MVRLQAHSAAGVSNAMCIKAATRLYNQELGLTEQHRWLPALAHVQLCMHPSSYSVLHLAPLRKASAFLHWQHLCVATAHLQRVWYTTAGTHPSPANLHRCCAPVGVTTGGATLGKCSATRRHVEGMQGSECAGCAQVSRGAASLKAKTTRVVSWPREGSAQLAGHW